MQNKQLYNKLSEKKKMQNLEAESSTLKDHDDDDHLTVEATV